MPTRILTSRKKQPLLRASLPIASRARTLAVAASTGSREREAEQMAEQVAPRSDTAPTQASPTDLPASGGPLPAHVRAYFEPRFGHDFSRVRLHTDARAARAAQALGAQAYTLGQDVVLGQGQYAPHTASGRSLLAHELAHVVQQGTGGAPPIIQRRLLASGDKKDIQAMFGLLEPASGFTLKHDPKTNEVSVTASVLKPQSFVLAGELASIMDDPNQDAEIHLGQDQPGVGFGQFPVNSDDLANNPVQEIRIDQMAALEKGAPGAGAAKMAHEIVENYTAHKASVRDQIWQVAFEESHTKALETENAIEAELGHPGDRRNTFSVVTDPGGGKPSFLLEIEDRETHFQVWDRSFGGAKSKVSNARRVPRVRVASYTIDGFQPGSDALPDAGARTIAAISSDMKKNPTASAFVEGFSSSGKTADEKNRLASDRAEMVRDLVIFLANDQVGVSWSRFHMVGQADASKNRVVITIDRPYL